MAEIHSESPSCSAASKMKWIPFIRSLMFAIRKEKVLLQDFFMVFEVLPLRTVSQPTVHCLCVMYEEGFALPAVWLLNNFVRKLWVPRGWQAVH